MTDEERTRLIRTASGEEKADLVIKNATVADVFGGGWLHGDVAVTGGRIAGVGSYSGKTETDGSGKYVLPAFYDAHLHFESVAVRPSEYLRLTVPRGVTAYNADPHEIANVCGMRGVEFMLDDVRGVPADVHMMMPSCVPATGEDRSGAHLTAEDAERGKKLGLFGLGEMMNVPGVLGCDKDVIKKLGVFGIIDGHAPALSGGALSAYAAAGVLTDHECTTVEEANDRISRGMYVLMREGSQAKNVRALCRAVNDYNADRFLFCTDDRNLSDVAEHGTIDNCVRIAVSCGIPPIRAIKIASQNAFAAYGIKGKGAIAPGYAADMFVCSDPAECVAEEVYHAGMLVARSGEPLFARSGADASDLRGTVVLPDLTEEDLALPFTSGMPVIEVLPETLYTALSTAESPEGLDLVCCIERHRALGEIGRAYVRGFGLRGGAIAQTVGHDSHNITVLGDNTRDMLLAVRALGSDGGFAVCSGGRITAKTDLEIGGLMSMGSAADALKARRELNAAVSALGHAEGIEPLMLLSFLTLTVIPDVKLNTKGLYDVARGRYVYRCDKKEKR